MKLNDGFILIELFIVIFIISAMVYLMERLVG